MKQFKEYSVRVTYEITGLMNNFLWLKKEYTETDARRFSVVAENVEEAKQKFSSLIIKKEKEIKDEIKRAITNNGKCVYTSFDNENLYALIYQLNAIKVVVGEVEEDHDFTKESVEYAFKNLTIEQFQEMWGSQLPK